MDFDLRQAIESLDHQQVFEIANQARPAGDYLFNSILPNRNMDTYDVEGGSMTIRTTMAGLSGMDSRYTEGGAAETSEFAGKTGKITIHSALPEKFLRSLQNLLLRLTAQRQDTTRSIQDTGLNFVDKIINQAILDRQEWLKGQALFTGKIDWTFNGKRLYADYGIPAGNFLPARTGDNRYGGSTSKFWEDVYLIQEKLNWDVKAIILHPTTLKEVMSNAEVNKLQFVTSNPATGVFTFKRITTIGNVPQVSSDPRDTVTLIAYNKEAEIWDLTSPGKTKKVPFCPIGAMLGIGSPVSSNVFVVGEGSTEAQTSPVQIGYGHVAPTVEGGGRPGAWTRLYVPQNEPWQMASDGVCNFLPVIEAEDRLVIATTQIGA